MIKTSDENLPTSCLHTDCGMTIIMTIRKGQITRCDQVCRKAYFFFALKAQLVQIDKDKLINLMKEIRLRWLGHLVKLHETRIFFALKKLKKTRYSRLDEV